MARMVSLASPGIAFSSISPPPSELVEVSSSVPVALVIKKGRIHTHTPHMVGSAAVGKGGTARSRVIVGG